MARTPKSDLADFHLYLKDVLGPTTASVTTYCSMVRRVLRSVPVLSEEALTNFFYNELNSTMRSNIRAAWLHYVRFQATIKGVDVPTPGYVRVPRGTSKTFKAGSPLPAEVIEAVFRLVVVRRWPITVILNGTWGKLVSRPASRLGDVALVFPFGKVTYWLAFQDELAPLRRWAAANGEPSVHQPLLPRETDGQIAYPGLSLQAALDALVVRPDMLDDPAHFVGGAPPVQAVPKPTLTVVPPAPKTGTENDTVGKPVSTQELEAILRSQRMPAAEPPPANDFFFVVDCRIPAEKRPPDGIRTRGELEAARAAAPPRTSAAGWAVHRAIDAEQELLEAWERGEYGMKPPEKVASAEPFVFDLDED